MCNHQDITIIERGDWSTSHTRNGGGWSHNNEPGDYLDMLEIHCEDCGLKGKYSRRRAPKWLEAILLELGIAA